RSNHSAYTPPSSTQAPLNIAKRLMIGLHCQARSLSRPFTTLSDLLFARHRKTVPPAVGACPTFSAQALQAESPELHPPSRCEQRMPLVQKANPRWHMDCAR